MRGDYLDADSVVVVVAVRGAYGVFSIQPRSGQPQYEMPDEDEVRFGIAIADGAERGGMEHFVYTSIGLAPPHAKVAAFPVPDVLSSLASKPVLTMRQSFCYISNIKTAGLREDDRPLV